MRPTVHRRRVTGHHAGERDGLLAFHWRQVEGLIPARDYFVPRVSPSSGVPAELIQLLLVFERSPGSRSRSVRVCMQVYDVLRAYPSRRSAPYTSSAALLIARNAES